MDYNITRFLEAQNNPYSGFDDAFRQISDGRKTGHWIWYIFPQLKSLGHSSMSKFYGIADLQEAKEYLNNETLASRLRMICSALLQHKDKSAVDILGDIDALKVRSSMTLFDIVSPDDVFADVLNAFYDGKKCGRTLMLNLPKP